MTREIIIDEDTVFGYYFPKKKFFIKNKGSETLRSKPSQAKRVLDIVAPNNNISVEDIKKLSETYEDVTSVSYTWADNGSYLSTIQFNDYRENPLVLDGAKKKLYIMNTNIVYDLTLTEGKRFRLEYIQAYYRNNLGLAIPLSSDYTFNLSDLYDLLISFYKPHVYNEIETPQETPRELKLKYSSKLALADYIETSPAHYTILNNPLNKYNPKAIGDILSMNGNLLTLVEEIPKYNKGAIIVVEGSEQVIDNETYSNDGEYKVVSHEGKEIVVEENFKVAYSFPYFSAYIVAYSSKVVSASRDNRTITLAENFPNSMLIGDKIILKNTLITTEFETISIDGEYTVRAVNGKVVEVEEDIPTNYNYSSGTQPIIYKRLLLGNILGWIGREITLSQDIPSTVVAGTYITLTNDRDYFFKVVSVNKNKVVVDANPNPNPYSPNYPKVQEKLPFPEMLVTVEDSTNEEELPVGEFILDNGEEVNAYLEIIPKLTLPSEENYANIGRYLEESMLLEVGGLGNKVRMNLLGLYSELYKNKS